MSDETPEKTTGALIPQKHGGALRNGGTNRGGPGRPTNEFRESVRKLLDSAKVRAAVKKVLGNPDHPQFATLYAKLMSQAHGNPTQQVAHTGAEGGPVHVRVTHEVIDPSAD